MQSSDRKSIRVAFQTGILLMGALVCAAAGAAESAKSNENSASCTEETRRVAVARKGGNPKFSHLRRYETRDVKVCDGKVVTQPEQRSASAR